MTKKFATRWRQAIQRPVGVRAKLRSALRAVAISSASLLTGRGSGQFLRGLYCHYVFDDQRDEFARIMHFLARRGRFVDTPTLVEMLEGRRPIDGPYFHLSFDDGFRNVFTNAVPLLSALNIPAIVFVPTEIIESNWESTRRYCIDTAEYAAVIEMMRWDDLRAMRSAGFEVGSHTRSHARLSKISDHREHLWSELHGAKRDIEARLDAPCRYFAWPFGRLADVDDTAIEAVREAGYDACFGAFRGSIVPKQTDRFRIPRHQFEAHWPLSHVQYFAAGGMETQSDAA